METSNLPDIEIKTLVRKMLNEHRGRRDELNENFNRELETIRKNQLEMKNTITEMKKKIH